MSLKAEAQIVDRRIVIRTSRAGTSVEVPKVSSQADRIGDLVTEAQTKIECATLWCNQSIEFKPTIPTGTELLLCIEIKERNGAKVIERGVIRPLAKSNVGISNKERPSGSYLNIVDGTPTMPPSESVIVKSVSAKGIHARSKIHTTELDSSRQFPYATSR